MALVMKPYHMRNLDAPFISLRRMAEVTCSCHPEHRNIAIQYRQAIAQFINVPQQPRPQVPVLLHITATIAPQVCRARPGTLSMEGLLGLDPFQLTG